MFLYPFKLTEINQADGSPDSTTKQEQVLLETTVDVLGSKPDTQDDFSSSAVGTNVDSAEKFTITAISGVLTDNSVLIKPEPSVAMIEEAKKPSEDNAVSECLLESVLQDKEVKVVEENHPSSHEYNHVSSDAEVILKLEETLEKSSPMPPKDAKLAEETDPLSSANNSASDIPSSTSKSEEDFETSVSIAPGDVKFVEETNPLSLDENNANDTLEAVPKLEETHEMVANPVPSCEFSPKDRVSSLVCLSSDNPQAELDMDQELEVSTSSNVVHEHDKGEKDEKFQVFSVPHDLPMVENPERVVEGFKDHGRMGWFQPDNAGTSEGILEKDRTITCPPKSQTEALKEGSEVSSDFQDPKDLPELESQKSKPVDGGVFIEGELISHHENKGTIDFKTFKDDLSVGNREFTDMVNASSERELPRITHELSGSSTEFLSCQTSIASSFNADDASVDDKSKVEIAHTAEAGQMVTHMKIEETLGEGVLQSASGMEKVDTAGKANNSKRDTEENLAENLKVPESAKNLHDMQVNLGSDPILDDSTSSHVMQEKGKLVVAEADATEAVGSVPESCENKRGLNTETVTAVAQERVAVTLENSKEGEMNGKDEVLQLSSEDRVVENDLASLDTASLVQAPATIGVFRDNDIGGSKSSHLQHEDGTNHITQTVVGSVIDASVDSRSTDSLDANWGSVSGSNFNIYLFSQISCVITGFSCMVYSVKYFTRFNVGTVR